jgi:nucleoside-diphosphate kinase
METTYIGKYSKFMAHSKKIYMSGNYTFTIVKPDAFQSGYTGKILDAIIEGGFRISALRLVHLTKPQAEAFYAIHKERPFFASLVDFMTSGPIVVARLEKSNAVEDFRKLIGATDPAKAEEGTIRKRFARSLQENAVHGSDSDENAAVESDFFFSKFDRF